jgi:hypothetical protein
MFYTMTSLATKFMVCLGREEAMAFSSLVLTRTKTTTRMAALSLNVLCLSQSMLD